jgi:amino-acid N-acetyltransferase
MEQIEKAAPEDLPAIRELLARLELPSQDLGAENQAFLVARDGRTLAGCVALEVYGPAALLRSLAVQPGRQKVGLGHLLHDRALALAAELGVRELFLLTTTAERFFARAGYARVARAAVPADLKQSHEFRTLCPEGAVCMARRLG